ncbi:hypothetical protein MMP65_03525 [Acinetobacter sp. ANC 3926]|nr:hypothetical protein [Acinetobacter genomosp. 15BJ]EOR08428.1 hypothetical protein F896_01726 [Acinetobacter genomosp. 15BJ]MCH7290535.1 hypothetical protein [Acinetobacter genomosp. 15BJ]
MITDTEVTTWVGRTQESKNKDIIHSKDYGLLGDGSDETLKLHALLQNTNSLIVFEKNKTYCFKGSLTLKGNTILFNSSKLLNLEAHQDWSVLVYANTYIIDGINLTIQSGHGLRILESNVKCESIFIESLNESLNIGCMLSSNLTNSFVSNIEIGSIYTKNFSSHILIYKVLKSKIDIVWMNNYVTGLYFRDCQDSKFGYIYARGLMTSGIGSAGQNGVLLESTLDNNATKNLSFNVIDIEDSAEHGIRFGGVYAIDNVHMNYIKTRNTGAGSAATGGGGLKILGGNRTGAFNYHTNISIGTLINEDCSTTKGLNNFAALIISHVKHIHINKHIVSAVHSTYSAK